MAAEGLSVQTACRVLGVSVSGFHAWRTRTPSTRSIRHALLTDLIAEIHATSRGVYGARRVHAELTLGRGVEVGHGAVEILMRRAGLQGATGRPKFRRIAGVATAEDRVERSFGRSERDQLWVTDITEHPTREGKVYCAVVLDAWSRRVVGWSIDSTASAALASNALGMAIEQRQPAHDVTVIHSDQGTQFTSWAFTRRAVDSGLLPSMGSVGDCYDCEHDPRAGRCRKRHWPVPADRGLTLVTTDPRVSWLLICRSRFVGEAVVACWPDGQ